jgi:WD40 repeat protein
VLTQRGPFLVGSPLPAGDALAIALSWDGNLLASAQRNGVIDLIDTNTKKSIGSSLRGHVGGIRDLEFSPDNRWLVSAGADGTLRLWTVADGMGGGGRKVGEAGDVIMGLCFNPDGTIVATGNGDGTVQLWNVMDGTPIGEPLIDVALGFNVVEFSHDGRGLIASKAGGTIYGWEIPSRRPLFEPIKGAHTSNLLHIAFSPSGDRFATVSTDGTSMVLEYPSGRIIGPAFGKHIQMGSVIFSPDGRLLIGGDSGGALHLWDVHRQILLTTTPAGHSQAIVDAELSKDGGLLATLGQDLVIRLWSFGSTYPVANRLKVSGRKAKGVAFGREGRLLAVGDDSGNVQIWELPSDRLLFTLKGHQHQVWAVAFAPDSRVLASGDRSGQIRLWNPDSGELQRILDAHDGSVWSLAFGPNGNQLLSMSDNQVGIWDMQNGTLQAELKHGNGRNTRAVLSPDGSKLAVTATDGIVRVWDWKNAVVVNQIKADDDVLWSAAFSPDSRQLATASSDEIVALWDLASGRQQADFTGHSGGATDVAYLSDGVSLVAVDRNGRLHWWDTGTGRRLSEAWSAHRGASWRIVVHPDGKRFATTGDDGLARVWDELSIDKACEIAQHALDDVRLRQYLGPDERSVACE